MPRPTQKCMVSLPFIFLPALHIELGRRKETRFVEEIKCSNLTELASTFTFELSLMTVFLRDGQINDMNSEEDQKLCFTITTVNFLGKLKVVSTGKNTDYKRIACTSLKKTLPCGEGSPCRLFVIRNHPYSNTILAFRDFFQDNGIHNCACSDPFFSANVLHWTDTNVSEEHTACIFRYSDFPLILLSLLAF